MSDDIIISPDVLRANRLPPNQVQTRKWPVLHAGTVPRFDPATWRFEVTGLVERPWSCSYEEFRSLPTVRVRADMHCVTRWSRLDNLWEGVSTRTVLEKSGVKPAARFVYLICEPPYPGEPPFTTNLPLEDFLGADCLFAWGHDGKELEPDHGWPLRLVVPRLYAWKSAKWVRGIELMAEDRPGFWESWENGGYHMRGNPWPPPGVADGERFRTDTPPSFFGL